MLTLELKIPPLAVAILTVGAMWGMYLLFPPPEVPMIFRVVAATIISMIGLGLGLAGIISFWCAKTTVNPLKPEASSALVCSGIYRFSRNPMYLGVHFVLVAWAVFLGSAWTLLGPVAFVLYINRFQILPEERVLSARFGTAYSAYAAKARRWL